jgi:hypothetical protein
LTCFVVDGHNKANYSTLPYGSIFLGVKKALENLHVVVFLCTDVPNMLFRRVVELTLLEKLHVVKPTTSVDESALFASMLCLGFFHYNVIDSF